MISFQLYDVSGKSKTMETVARSVVARGVPGEREGWIGRARGF